MRPADALRAAVRHRFARQYSLLLAANAAVAVISFVSNLLINNHLSELDYGTYRYAVNYLQLGVSIATLGLPYSAARLLALERDRGRQRRVIGAAYALMALACLAGLLLTWAAYFGARALGIAGMQSILAVAPLLLCVTVFEYTTASLCGGTNDIRLLSSQLALPAALLLLVTAALVYALRWYGLAQALGAFALAHTVVIAVGIRRMRPSLREFGRSASAILRENRTTGLPIYLGGLIGVSSVQLISLTIPSAVGMEGYAQYALAYSVSAPLSLAASTLGTVLFRSSAIGRGLPAKALLLGFGGCAALAAVYVPAIQPLIAWLFGARYLPAAPMARVLGAGALMVGLGDMLNRYLGASGHGRLILAGAAATGLAAVLSAAAMIPAWGAMGAAGSRAAANAAYLLSMVILYAMRNTKPGRKEGGGNGA